MLTLKQVAAIFHVSRQTLYAWIAEGRLSVVKIGKLVRVEESEIERIKRG